ncbi:MAG: 50S ribosomal protein L29 [Candidatus Pacebacteria bacterium]|nr:50S ribosomal protein L29 [Candidatus Paceibacterota bacterium]
MKTKEIREKSDKELQGVVREGKETLKKLRFSLANRQLKGSHEIKVAKKDIAIAKTILSERAMEKE